jgi:hypothetical protein
LIRNTALLLANLLILQAGKFVDLRINKFKVELRFAEWLQLKNLRICDCGMSQRICGFQICGLTKKFACPPWGIWLCTTFRAQLIVMHLLKIPLGIYLGPPNFICNPIKKQGTGDWCERREIQITSVSDP